MEKVDLRSAMPETAKWVDQQRRKLGATHVNSCLRRAMKGEPGLFYAIECGHVLGTPASLDTPMGNAQRWAVVMGTTFAGFIATPEGAAS